MTVLGLVILGFVTHDITHIETCVAAMLGASFLLLFEKPTDILRDVEWNTIFFFIGLFIIIGGVEASGGIKLMDFESYTRFTRSSFYANTLGFRCNFRIYRQHTLYSHYVTYAC